MKHLKKVKTLIFRGESSFYRTPLSQKMEINVEQKREMGTFHGWEGSVRKKNPGTPKNEPLETRYDPITGEEYMHEIDYSGANHSFLRNLHYKHPTNPNISQIFGVFTSSTKPIKGVLPEMIANHLFDGTLTPQFFFRYATPKIIETEFIEKCPIVDLSPEYIKRFLESLDRDS